MTVRRAHPLQSEEQWVPGSRVVLHPLQRKSNGYPALRREERRRIGDPLLCTMQRMNNTATD